MPTEILSPKQLGLLRRRILEATTTEQLVLFLGRIEQLRTLGLEQLYTLSREKEANDEDRS